MGDKGNSISSRREALQLVAGIGTATLAATGVATADSTGSSQNDGNGSGELNSSEDTHNDSLTISEAFISEKLDEEDTFTVKEEGTTYEITGEDNQESESSSITASDNVVNEFCITRNLHDDIPVDICFTLYECGAQVEIDMGLGTGGYDLPCGETVCKEEEYTLGFGEFDWDICQETDGDIEITYDGWVWYGLGTESISGEIEVTR